MASETKSEQDFIQDINMDAQYVSLAYFFHLAVNIHPRLVQPFAGFQIAMQEDESRVVYAVVRRRCFNADAVSNRNLRAWSELAQGPIILPTMPATIDAFAIAFCRLPPSRS